MSVQGKPIVELSDDELDAEIARLQNFKVPAAPTAKSPRRPTDAAAKKGKRPSWKDELGL